MSQLSIRSAFVAGRGLAVLVGACARGAPPASRMSAACTDDTKPFAALTVQMPRKGHLGRSESRCYAMPLAKGEFVRVSLDIESGYARVRVLAPATRSSLIESWAWGAEFVYPSMPITLEAPASGLYTVEISSPGWEQPAPAGPFTLRLKERLGPESRAARRAELRDDPRTVWLRDNAVAIRSVDPLDEDFSDLEFLRRELDGVRIVLLGELDHGAGTDLAAKARLVKFLHRELAFDVLAFESGLFEASIAWEALQTDADPRDAFLQGVFRVWGWSEQVQPLISYLASSARSRHPLELAGFDPQFTGTASTLLYPRLRQFLSDNGIAGPLTNPNSASARTLAAVAYYPPSPDRQRPTEADRGKLVETLRRTADQVESGTTSRAAEFWRQVLRSAAAQVESSASRDRQMAENLVWLVETYYSGRKVVAWLHNQHAIRNPTFTGGRLGFTMGHGVWQTLGEVSFVIGFTSYSGTLGCITCERGLIGMRQDIGPDPHASLAFEELMAAAGFEFAFVNLRGPREGGEWLQSKFIARPLLAPANARWSDILDGLFFVRTQQPSTRVGIR